MKTTTLTDSSGNPTIITFPGFVDRKKFNKAMLREWSSDPITKDAWNKLRKYEFFVPHKTKAWKNVDAGTKGAKPFTVMPWD